MRQVVSIPGGVLGTTPILFPSQPFAYFLHCLCCELSSGVDGGEVFLEVSQGTLVICRLSVNDSKDSGSLAADVSKQLSSGVSRVTFLPGIDAGQQFSQHHLGVALPAGGLFIPLGCQLVFGVDNDGSASAQDVLAVIEPVM